jgi:hypothetical protein
VFCPECEWLRPAGRETADSVCGRFTSSQRREAIGGATTRLRQRPQGPGQGDQEGGIERDEEQDCFSYHSAGAVDPVRVARFLGNKVETILSTYAHEWAARGDNENLGGVLAGALSVTG